MIILILLSFGASISTKIIRQHFLLRKLGIVISFKENILIYLASLSLTVTPGSVGHILKSYSLLKDHNQPIAKTIPVVITERYYDAIAMTFYLIVFSFFFWNSIGNLILVFSIVFGLILAICLIAVRIGAIPKITRMIFVSKFKLIQGISNTFSESYLALESLSSSKKFIFDICVISLVAWFFDAMGVYLCFEALQMNLDFFTATIFYFSSTLLGAVSLLPAGIGVTEIALVKLLASQGIGLIESTSVVLLIRLCSIWFSTFIGVGAMRIMRLKKNKKLE
jgi:uncharacterized protein (TIRG00374 family)